MVFNIKRMINQLFEQGINKGDLFWFIHWTVIEITKNGICFAICYALMFFCGIEVACQLFLLTNRPTVHQILHFGPMFITSVQVISDVVPILFKRYDYKKIYKEFMEVWSLRSCPPKGVLGLRELFDKGLVMIGFYACLMPAAASGYLPFNGINSETSVWPAIAVLQLFSDGPKAFVYLIIFFNFFFVFFKGFFLVGYGLHLMHFTTLYNAQNVLLRSRLANISCYTGRTNAPPLMMEVEDQRYQRWVARELKECIKLHMRLKKFSNCLIDYFKWALLFHVGNVILLLAFLYYIIVFMNGGSDPWAARLYVIGANLMVVLYIYNSEIFHEQTEKNRCCLFKTPWHTFDKSNRKLVLIFLANLQRPRYLTALHIFDLNFNLLIFIMHKCFNTLTLLSKLSPELQN